MKTESDPSPLLQDFNTIFTNIMQHKGFCPSRTVDRLKKIERSLPLLEEQLEKMETKFYMRIYLAIGIGLVVAYQVILWLLVVPDILKGASAWYFIFFIFGIFLHGCTCTCIYPAFFENWKTSTRGYNALQRKIKYLRHVSFNE
jgi:hypothetical protein